MGTCKLQRGLPGFGAGVAEEDAVQAADLGEAKGEFGGVLVEEEVGGVEELRRLRGDRVVDGGVAVAERADADAAEQVKVSLPFSSRRWTPWPPTKQEGVALVGLQKQLASPLPGSIRA